MKSANKEKEMVGPRVSTRTMEFSSKNLPHEVIIEILSWLPVKHILKFRCVSKNWLQLLTLDPHFAELHLHRSIKSSPLSVLGIRIRNQKMNFYLATEYTACGKALLLESPFHLSSAEYLVSGICNGLVCLSGIREDKVYIWNPLTRDYITISYSSIPSSSDKHTKGTAFAFGFHQDTNEYKVLRLSSEWVYGTDDFHLHLSVYTLGIDSSWRTVEDNIHYMCPFGIVNNPLVNGVLHWLARKPGESSSDMILSFDLKDEVLRHILPPYDEEYDDVLDGRNIEELDGLLCVIAYHWLDFDVQIWAMQEYGVVSSWTKLFMVRETGVSQSLSSMIVIGACNGEIILTENFVKLFLYDQETKEIKSLEGFPFKFDYAYTYVGSIVSPRVIGGVGHIMT